MNSPETLPQRTAISEDEISLSDLWQMLAASWRWLLGGLVAGLLAAGGYLGVTPAQYEATLLLKVGQVVQTSSGNAPQTVPVETPAQAVERLKLTAFQEGVLKSLGWSGDARAALYRSSIKPALRNDLVEVKLRAASADDARRAAEATIAQLASAHSALRESQIRGQVVAASQQKIQADKNTRAEIISVLSEVRQTEELLARLDRLGKEIPATSHRELLTLISMTDSYKSRLHSLKRQEAELKNRLDAPPVSLGKEIVATAAIEPAAITDGPVFPKARQVWVLAALGGLFLGMMAIILRRGWQARRVARGGREG